jgi:hypothetical protein
MKAYLTCIYQRYSEGISSIFQTGFHRILPPTGNLRIIESKKYLISFSSHSKSR